MSIPFEYFFRKLAYAQCPECRLYKPAGFAGEPLDRGTCTACMARHIENALWLHWHQEQVNRPKAKGA